MAIGNFQIGDPDVRTTDSHDRTIATEEILRNEARVQIEEPAEKETIAEIGTTEGLAEIARERIADGTPIRRHQGSNEIRTCCACISIRERPPE